MCGRYTLHAKTKAVEAALDAAFPEPLEPDYNIGPGRAVPGLRKRHGQEAVAGPVHWGLRSSRNFIINARLESADQIHRFREGWQAYRCLLPANGFYEWRRGDGRKTAYYFRHTTEPLVALAGLCFPAPEYPAGTCCVILTTAANEAVRPIHHRMPVCLPLELREAWLGGALGKAELADRAAATPWTQHPVSPRVNAVRNNDAELIREAAPESDPQLRLLDD